MSSTPASPPAEVVAGDTIEFVQAVPTELVGWAGSARITGPGTSLINATAIAVEGAGLRITFEGQSAGGTKTLLPGRHSLTVWMTSGNNRHTIAQYALEITPNAAVGTPALAHAEKMLSLCETAIENRIGANADGGIEEYDIEGTQVRKIALKDLYALRAKYAAEVRRLRQPDAPYSRVPIAFSKAGGIPSATGRRYG